MKHNNYPIDDSNMIPSGQLYLVRSPSSPKSENECLYNDAILTIRETNHSFVYQMVIWKGNLSDSDSLNDDDNEDSDTNDNFFENDSNILKSFIIDSNLNICLFERYQQKIISWKDMEGDLGDMFEYRITSTVPNDTIEQFITAIYKCKYEQKYKKSSANINVNDIKEFIIDKNESCDNCLNFANNSTVSSTLDMKKLLSPKRNIADEVEFATESDSDEDADDDDDEDDEYYKSDKDYYNEDDDNEDDEDDDNSNFVDASEVPSNTNIKPNIIRILIDSFPCETYSYNAEIQSFTNVSNSTTISLYQISNWNYCIEIKDNKDNNNKIYAISAIDEKSDPTFRFEQFSFLFNVYNEKSATTWLVKFENRSIYESFQKVYMKLNWQYKNQETYSTEKRDEDYLIDSLEAMDIDDEDDKGDRDELDEDDEEVEEPTHPLSSFQNKKSKNIVDESDDSDYDSDEEDKFQKHSKNSGLAVGLATNRTFISKDDKLGVFKTDDSGINFISTIDKLSYSKDKRKRIRPNKMMLMDNDRTMIIQGKNELNNLHKIDIEYGKVVEDWEIGNNNNNNITNIESFTTNEKYGNLSKDPTFLGLSSQSMFKIDPRMNKGFISTEKNYKTKVGFKEISTTNNGYIAVASDNGEIRLYDQLGKNAKTALPALGDKIIGLDVSSDGRYVLATCPTYLLLIDTKIKDGKYSNQLGFVRSFPADSKPKPIRLQLKPENIAYIKQNFGKNLIYSPAKFNESSNGESARFIISSIGPFAITWDLKKILNNKKDIYKIRRYQDDVIMSEFVNNDDKHMVLALSDNVALASTSSFRRPVDEFSIVKTAF